MNGFCFNWILVFAADLDGRHTDISRFITLLLYNYTAVRDLPHCAEPQQSQHNRHMMSYNKKL